ncbi:hypothetical protein Rhein_0432 [Rheinheimera sp. A13L]|uniref:hypothetical protein n=1 Tax=Rheinheimera sp. A13L TaxID=506534 RepID=UPI0002124816|nr:hypothetical protein [Rheinheimera sp. A13L]EGM79297.1 hypothetical protein Rhein_0432 [Rheinheimera sp. A13L]
MQQIKKIAQANVALLCLLSTMTATAYEVSVKAEYRTVKGVNQAEFTDTTSCGTNYWCSYMGQRRTVIMNATGSVLTITVPSTDPRQNLYYKVPGSRTVNMTNAKGQTHILTFNFSAIGGVYRRTESNGTMPGLHELTGNISPDNAGSSCERRWAHGGSADTGFAWNIMPAFQSTGTTCHKMFNKSSRLGTWEYGINLFFLAYALDTPNPLAMESGVYTGNLTFSVGPGGEIDFGDNVTTTSNQMTVNFELNVMHDFIFQFPAAESIAVLEPAGGWASYNGANPGSINKDIPFRVTNSGPFTMYLACEHDLNVGCGVKAASGRTVRLNTSITLPGAIRLGNGSPVNRVPLPVGRLMRKAFTPVFAVSNQQGLLHFDITNPALEGMLKDTPGERYEGDVTLMIESELFE